MSSAEDDHFDNEGSSERSREAKKRKIQRACDICRRKKVRCDGGQMPDNKCSNCIACAFDCTYVEAAKKRGPTKGYVEGLEVKVDKMEKLIRQLCPDESTFKMVMASVESKSPVVDYEPLYPSSMMSSSNSDNHPKPVAPTILDSIANAIRNVPQDRDAFPEDEDDKIAYVLSERVKAMRIEPFEYRFFGKSSGAVLIQRAIEARSDFIGTDTQVFNPIVSGFRPKFWTLKDWERKPHIMSPSTPFEFPDHDLMMDLFALYFKHLNLFMPLLHRPTFEREVQDELHLKDTSFALVVLLVCAVGSRFSDDPRTRLEADDPHSAGWKWFHQAVIVQRTFVAPHNLYDLQYYPMAVQFLSASAVPQACWSLIGIGLRVAQDIGAHRRGLPKAPSFEEELRKRAFWIMIVLDRIFSSALGRPCGMKDEDFDLDLPIDCDDEYWNDEDPLQRFAQPKGKPSKIAAFISMIKLTQIISVTLRTIYAINKSKVLFGFSEMNWQHVVIAELDSALNAWIDSVPHHLIWDPNREDEDFFNQSLALYANYYHTQIIVHRPFIPAPNRPSSVSFPSLAICTGAARSCSHLVDLRKTRGIPPVLIHGPLCTAALVLLLNLWSSKRTGLAQETVKRDMEDVYNCMEVLKMSEDRYHISGRLWDVLRHLADAGEFPLPESSSQPSKKRARGTDFSGKGDEGHDPALKKNLSRPRNIAGSHRASKERPKPSTMSQPRNPVGLDTPSPQSSISSSEMDEQSSNFTTPANHLQPLHHSTFSKDVLPSPLSSSPFSSSSDGQFSGHNTSSSHPLNPPSWYSLGPQPSGSKPSMGTSQPNLNGYSTFGPQSGGQAIPNFTNAFTMDSGMGPSMFSMDNSTDSRRSSHTFGAETMEHPSMDGMFTMPMTLLGGVDQMLSMPSTLPNPGMGPDLMDMSVWSGSPAGLLFQDFAPYLAQLNAPFQQPPEHQNQGPQY